jgi:uroporphyrinogen decarboxylase
MDAARLDRKVEARILAAMNHEEPDRVPIWDYIDNPGIVRHFSEPGDDYPAAMKKVYRGLGIDLCRGFGASYTAEQDGAASGDDDDQSVISGQTSWRVKYPIKSIEDLRRCHPPVVDDSMRSWMKRDWVGQIRGMQELFAPHTMYVAGSGCGFSACYREMGQVLFSYAIYDARDDLERALEGHTQMAVAYAEAAAEVRLGPMYFIGDDIAYKGALMFSPDFLRETLIKSLARTVEPLKKAGIKVIFHSDGYLMDILDDLVDVGIDGLNPIEPLAGMDIGSIKRRYGKRLILVGNVDCSQVLPLGSVRDVIDATKECIKQASSGGGHFIGSSSEIVPSTPVENILAFYSACHTYGTYPIAV